MRISVVLLAIFFIGFPYWNAHAEDQKDVLFNQCMGYQKGEAFCQCAVGKPYEDMYAERKNVQSKAMGGRLEALEARYKKAYEIEMERGGINPSQIDQVCEIVDEYYDYLDELGMDYKTTSGKKSSLKRDAVILTNEQRQALTEKRIELNKRIHELNHTFQKGGAMGSFSTLSSGTCRLRLEVEWYKEKMGNSKVDAPASVPVKIGIRQLMARSMDTCGGL